MVREGMRESIATTATQLGVLCRSVTVALLSGWLTRRSYEDVEARLVARPVPEQTAIVAATLGALFLLALLAAQAGFVGMCIYGLAVVLVAR